jgi:hypothetical protein
MSDWYIELDDNAQYLSKKIITWYKWASFELLNVLVKGALHELIISCQGYRKEFYCINSKSKSKQKQIIVIEMPKQHKKHSTVFFITFNPIKRCKKHFFRVEI